MPPSPPPTPQTLLDWLAARYPTAKRQTLRRMLKEGRVTLNGRRVISASRAVTAADMVAVAEHARPAAPVPPPRGPVKRPPRLDVLYEDDDLLVVDKPPGLLTSTVPREPRPTLLAAVRDYLAGKGTPHTRPRVGLIHRLDRDASGLLVFSKTHDAYRSLKRQFFEHTVERVYTAVVEGVPTPRAGRIESRLVERADGTVYSTKLAGEGERAITDYEVVEERAGRSLVRVTLYTGRKHQIRVHLSQRGAPIVGDKMYGRTPAAKNPKAAKAATRDAAKSAGDAAREPPPRLMLAATRLSLTHPTTGERLTFERPMPGAFATAFAAVFPAPVAMPAGRADEGSGATPGGATK